MSNATSTNSTEHSQPPPTGGGISPRYYFVQHSDSPAAQHSGHANGNVSFDSPSLGNGAEETIDVVPNGATSDEFASRPVIDRPRRWTESSRIHTPQRVGFVQKILGVQPRRAVDIGPSAPTGTLVIPRKVPIKIEPKVFFANERTFLTWLHQAVWLAGASLTILQYADGNPYSQFYGLLLLPVALAFIVYALYRFLERAALIHDHRPGPYVDTLGPTVLGIMLMLSIVAMFAVKLYSLLA